jgi:multidrug efflux pump subunit AcrA (membrane-fusion protein)
MHIPLPAFVRTHKKKSIAAAIVLAVILLIVVTRKPAQPEYITELAKKGDLTQTVEAVGTVVSERELELRFEGAGIVQQVFVKEGDHVKAGQRLGQLKAGSLGASVAAEAASLQSALAELRALQEGSRPEDIAIAEADVAGKRASLESAQTTLKTSEQNLKSSQDKLALLIQETNVNLAGQVSTNVSSLSEQLVAAESALSVIDDILGNVDVQDAIVKDRPGADNDVRAQKRSAQDFIMQARTVTSAATDYQSALKAMDAGKKAASSSVVAMDSLFSLISGLRETNNFTNSSRESYKTSISTQRAKLQDMSSSISTLQSNLQNASASYDTKIAAERSAIISLQGTRDKAATDIITYQASIQSAEAQLALKRAGARQTDIDGAQARVRSAQANLARAQANYSQTVLTAPISGTVSHVNINIGESLPAGAAVTLLGDSPFRVEMFVSEIDVPKLMVTQSGSIELDAFRGTHMKLHLSEVDSSPTSKDGVPKYRVKLDFDNLHPELKIGMTGDAEIITGERKNVVSAPRRAILEDNDGRLYVRILNEDKTITERTVTIGMEGQTGDTEILSGLEGGENIVVLIKQ